MNAACHTPIATQSRRGYTLVELTVALPIMAMLAVGMASAINIATKAVPDGTSTASATLTSTRALDTLTSELAFATSIATDVRMTGATKQLTFTIPDRDGVAPTTESLTYSWSGTAGDPLLRTFNGTTSTVATNVQEFELGYDKRATSVVSTTTNTSGESLLISSDGTAGDGDATVKTAEWCGQYFLPVLASTVTGWTVTKVQLRAKLNGDDKGEVLVQIRPSQGTLPTSTVLAQQKMLEKDTSSNYTLQTYLFSGVPVQSPAQGLCLVLQFDKETAAGDFKTWKGGSPFSSLLKTTTSGSAWSADSARSLCYYVYGTVNTESSSTTTSYLLTNVRCALRVGSSAKSRLTTSVRILNEPQVNGP